MSRPSKITEELEELYENYDEKLYENDEELYETDYRFVDNYDYSFSRLNI